MNADSSVPAAIRAWLEVLRIELTRPDDLLTMLNRVILALCLVMLLAAFGALLARRANLKVQRRWTLLEAEWDHPMLEILSGRTPPGALSGSLHPSDRLFFLDYLMRYALRLKGPEREIVSVLARPFLPLLAARLSSREPSRRARALYTLGTLDPKAYAGQALQSLDDPSPLVAVVAAQALQIGNQPRHAQAVLAKLHRFGSLSPNYLASLLASIGPGAAPALRETLGNRSLRADVRAIAAEALVRLHDAAAGAMLPDLLRHETDRNLLKTLLTLAREAGDPSVLAPIRDLASSDDFALRAHAIRALGELGTPEDMALVRRAVLDPNPWVGRQAALALRERHLLEPSDLSPSPQADGTRQFPASGPP